jgi:hypothetical protein
LSMITMADAKRAIEMMKAGVMAVAPVCKTLLSWSRTRPTEPTDHRRIWTWTNDDTDRR